NAVPLTESSLVLASVTNISQLVLLTAVFYLVRQLLDGERVVKHVLLFMVWAGVGVAVFALVERVVGVNVFLLLDQVLPLQRLREGSESFRGGGSRAYASSQHP